ncbi:acyltransferase [Francisella philomiragia]|uniref:acyltransferase n=1 Tax=Francisella philomiragia TaxID=28110 RepID=UPI001F2372C4|nr:acyltransferase [Francisella philomiragia]
MEKNQVKHWSKIREAGGLFGLRTTFILFRLLGRRLTYSIMSVVMIYYFLLYKSARNYSFKYIKHLDKNIKTSKLWFYSFKHFLAFGEMVIDKIAVWSNKITIDNVDFSLQDRKIMNQAIKSQKGGVIFTAHLGNLDVARSLADFDSSMKINALVFSKQAPTFNKLLTKINPKYSINMICIQDVTPDLAIELYERIANREFIVIPADRTSVTKPERNLRLSFLDDMAFFPQGAFILASILKCPTYFMLCPKKDRNNFDFIFKEFDQNSIILNRKTKQQDLEKYAQKYAKMLELYCKKYPKQWFNFFDFWHQGE